MSSTISPPISKNQLDEISGGRIDWKKVLRNFWRDFSGCGRRHQGPTITQVLDALDEALGPHFFPNDGAGRDPRAVPGLRQRPARPEARQVRRIHRLLELSELPLHPAARGRRAKAKRLRRHGAGHRPGERTCGNVEKKARSGITYSSARQTVKQSQNG